MRDQERIVTCGDGLSVGTAPTKHQTMMNIFQSWRASLAICVRFRQLFSRRTKSPCCLLLLVGASISTPSRAHGIKQVQEGTPSRSHLHVDRGLAPVVDDVFNAYGVVVVHLHHASISSLFVDSWPLPLGNHNKLIYLEGRDHRMQGGCSRAPQPVLRALANQHGGPAGPGNAGTRPHAAVAHVLVANFDGHRQSWTSRR